MCDGITEIQCRCNRIIKELATSTYFVKFLRDSYQFLSGLFHKFRIPPKKLKCNWCLLISKLYNYLQSMTYLAKCKQALNTGALNSDLNSIFMRIHFDLFQRIVHNARDDLRMDIESECQDMNLEMELSEQNTLRYI